MKVNVMRDEKASVNTIFGEPVQGRIILPDRSFLSPAAPSSLANVPATTSAVSEEISLTRNQNKWRELNFLL